MLRTFAWIPLLVSISSIESLQGASIVIAPARTRVVASRAELAKTCGTSNRIFGCTSFAGEKLVCTCERDAEAWRIHANAQFIPFIYIYARHLDGISHEREHIEDIRVSVDKHITDLQSDTYSSLEDCDNAGNAAMAAFARRMNEWKITSNLERHPELQRESR